MGPGRPIHPLRAQGHRRPGVASGCGSGRCARGRDRPLRGQVSAGAGRADHRWHRREVRPASSSQPGLAVAPKGSPFEGADLRGRYGQSPRPGLRAGRHVCLRLGQLRRGRRPVQRTLGHRLAADGRVYVVDTWNHRIQLFTPDGQFLKQWGVRLHRRPARSDGRLLGNRAIAFRPKGTCSSPTRATSGCRSLIPRAQSVDPVRWRRYRKRLFRRAGGHRRGADGGYLRGRYLEPPRCRSSTPPSASSKEWPVPGWEDQNIFYQTLYRRGQHGYGLTSGPDGLAHPGLGCRGQSGWPSWASTTRRAPISAGSTAWPSVLTTVCGWPTPITIGVACGSTRYGDGNPSAHPGCRGPGCRNAGTARPGAAAAGRACSGRRGWYWRSWLLPASKHPQTGSPGRRRHDAIATAAGRSAAVLVLGLALTGWALVALWSELRLPGDWRRAGPAGFC